MIQSKNILNNIIATIDKEKEIFDDPTVEGGTMGCAIFFYYCHQYFKDDKYLYKAEEMVEKSINLISNISNMDEFNPKYRGYSLSNIFASFGKGLLFIENKFNYGYDFSSYYKIISDTLETLLEKDLKRKNYDFFGGAISSAYYFLNKIYYTKGKDENSVKNLKIIYESSKEASLFYNENEIYWKSTSYSDRVYIGLSHGSAMMINFWSKLYQFKIINSNNKDETDWLDKAVNFVFKRKREFVDGYFPHFAFTPESIEKTQLAMCYGDLGVIYSLFNANKILKNKEYKETIDKMLYTTSLREKETKYTYDAGVLYGASGVGYIFENIGKNEENVYKNTIGYWNNQVFTICNANNDLLYQFDYNEIESSKYSFLWGLSGIGIRLMHIQSPLLPSINELLLIGI